MVNYDKWDKMDVSDDEDDRPRRANVTRLDGPSRVTFGGGRGDVVDVETRGAPTGSDPDTIVTPGAAAAAAAAASARATAGTDYAKFDRIAADVSDEEDDREYYEDEAHAALYGPNGTAAADARAVPPAPAPAPAPSTSPAPSPATDPAAATLAERTARFTANGGRDARSPGAPSGEGYMWSQDRDEVCVSVVAPAGARARDVAVRCTSTRVEVAIMAPPKPGAVVVARCLLSDEWAHPVDPEPKDPDDDDDGEEADAFGDWEVCDWEPASLGGRRVVRVTARKRGMGMLTHWWRKATVGGAEIDPAEIAARKPGKAEEAKRVWDEATEAFKQRVRERERIEVPPE